MYITINNEKYELTAENILELNRQEAIETARNAIDGFIESIDENVYDWLTDTDLCNIGEDILNRILSDTGDIEFYILERYGLIKEV
ncbi:MAG: hypothetical protein MJ230_07190 [bacterium]|nr:hypothetical protein [bacterium]